MCARNSLKAAALRHAADVAAGAKRLERMKLAEEAALDAGPDAELAKKLGVVVVKAEPPRKSKQPNRPKERESMGTLANTDDKGGLLSEYQKFRAAEDAAEEAADGGGGGDDE